MSTSKSVKNWSKSTKMRKLLFFGFLSGTSKKKGQNSVQKNRIPDDVSGFQNFGTPFWRFYACKRRFSWISEKRDLHKSVYAPRTSTKTSIFEDFFHFHHQKSKNDVFRSNPPYTEHYMSVFVSLFFCIMHMYVLQQVWRFITHFHSSVHTWKSLTK